MASSDFLWTNLPRLHRVARVALRGSELLGAVTRCTASLEQPASCRGPRRAAFRYSSLLCLRGSEPAERTDRPSPSELYDHFLPHACVKRIRRTRRRWRKVAAM